MKFTCHCGHKIADQTDDLPHKAHFIPDQHWNALWDKIEERILTKLGSRKLMFEAAAMQLRILFSDVTRLAYQCRECGRLYLDDEHGKLHCYVPQTENESREILSDSN